jgi:MFS transporter, ACS family, D-galactonate transporter
MDSEMNHLIQDPLKKTNIRYGMLSLVFVNVMINYLDRTNLAVAQTSISKDLGLDKAQMGYILSAFGWTYALLQVPGGIIADKVGPRILYAFCLVTWSLATMVLSVASGFAALFGFRLAIGAFEAPSYPINNRVVTSWFPDNERAAAIALYVSGQFIGLAFFTPVLFAIQVYYGWQGLFLITGGVGLLWGFVWYFFYRDPLDHPKVNKAELEHIEKGGGMLEGRVAANGQKGYNWQDLKQVLTGRTLWGVYIGQFCVNAMLWFFLTWFPTYLVEYRGLTQIKSGFLGSVPYLAACAGLLLSGFVSDRLVQQGRSVAFSRKTPIIIGLLLSVSIVGANYTQDITFAIAFMSLAFFGAGMALISWVFVSLLSPKPLVGLTGGVFNFMGNLASIIVPVVIGYILKYGDGDFRPALLFIGALGFIGALSYIFLVGKVERVTTK